MFFPLRLEPLLAEIEADHKTLASSYLDWINPTGNPELKVPVLEYFNKTCCLLV